MKLLNYAEGYFDHRSAVARPMMASLFSPTLRLMMMIKGKKYIRLRKHNRMPGQG